MVTRAKDGIIQPRLNPTLLLTHFEPLTHKQSLLIPEWYAAMKSEYETLITTNKTFHDKDFTSIHQ